MQGDAGWLGGAAFLDRTRIARTMPPVIAWAAEASGQYNRRPARAKPMRSGEAAVSNGVVT